MFDKTILKCGFRDKSGATAIEFALVAPMFFIVVFAIMETSVLVMNKFTLRSIIFEVTRDLQTGEIQRSGDPADAFKKAYCGHTPKHLDCADIQFDVRSFASLQKIKVVKPSFNGKGKATNFVFKPGKQEEITMVTATMPYSFNTPLLKDIFQSDGEPVLVVGYAITKNEPFGCVGNC
ncbi:TadE/TadG family type IV pilus assembly protein [Aquisalinus flavus]|uniref:Pilus biosynthesis protein TadE n=1 Tax=Aquisalinus flavus TaxID=1526572 RepID=A0A8J2Y4T3_9PROT|nr:TadE/TadG family type IV pilus assembly protein [Aquisalinus flavus]MBD0427577.1 pilus assembly protein [Aquisalinus flavus]UNE47369.1 pilus assembly protein [Aquisalinus flavus]GGD02095.1 pilus biosynthesis protein TadE [Aquisalinus flavus]